MRAWLRSTRSSSSVERRPLNLERDDLLLDLLDAEEKLLPLIFPVGQIAGVKARLGRDEVTVRGVVGEKPFRQRNGGRPSRSATSRARRASASASCAVRIDSSDRDCASSSRKRTCPASTASPSRTAISAHDAAVAVLNLLEVLVDLDGAHADDGAGQHSGEGPAADAAQKPDRKDHAGDDAAAEPVEVAAAPGRFVGVVVVAHLRRPLLFKRGR